SAIRGVRARYGISPKESLAVTVSTSGDTAVADANLLAGQKLLVETMANTAELEVGAGAEKSAQSSVTIIQGLEVYVALEGLVDFEAERKRLTNERTKVAADLQKLNKKLTNENFLAKADSAIVEKTAQESAELTAALEQIDQQLENLS
ncbi:MAG: valine--tRNA ligase, partial [Coriobacteriaceae bacterium]|nr:valine--tRNA ligase [Coriobacteriaceae bacterium]